MAPAVSPAYSWVRDWEQVVVRVRLRIYIRVEVTVRNRNRVRVRVAPKPTMSRLLSGIGTEFKGRILLPTTSHSIFYSRVGHSQIQSL